MKVPKQDLLSQDLGQWLDEPQIAFESWLARESASAAQARNFRNTSQTVYSSMWRHFMKTLAARNIPLHRVTSEELQKFLQSLDANQEHRSRYHLLLGRVFAYLGELGLRNDSPRFGISEEDYATTCNAPMPFLSALQREELTDVAHVLGSREQDVSVTQSMALTLLLLGAGLKVGEALRCTVNCIDIDGGWVNLPSPAAVRPHRALLLFEMRAGLSAWIQTRGSDRELVFPARRIHSKAKSLDPASAFRGVLRICEAAPSLRGALHRISPQTLRNSYLASLIDLGHSAELITEYLGFSRRSSALRAIRAYEQWCAREAATPGLVASDMQFELV